MMQTFDLEKQKAREITMRLVQAQRKAIGERDFDLWMHTMYCDDTIANEMQRLWFEGYLQRIIPIATTVELISMSASSEQINVAVKIRLEYLHYDALEEEHLWTVSFVPKVQEWRIVWLAKAPKPFPKEVAKLRFSFEPRSVSTDGGEPWWTQQKYLSLTHASLDPLPASTYAKAISRTVRSREEHPEIECAAILSDLMSIYVSDLAAQLTAPDLLQSLANLYRFSRERVSIRITRSDRGNTWNSKLNAPWFGIDEIIALSSKLEFITGSCPSMMSFYFALLRLGGYGPNDLYQLRLHNHDVLLAKVGQETYLVRPDDVVLLTPRTLHYSSQVYKIFTDAWYWTRFGATNLEETSQPDFLSSVQNAYSIFQFNVGKTNSNKHILPSDDALNLDAIKESGQAHSLIKKRILESSNRHPHSPFTWAKYAYQTLFVIKPEAYAICSLSNLALYAKTYQFSTLNDVFKLVQGFGLQSIFKEDDRLMTADQVLLHERGDPRARALLLFALFGTIGDAPSFVLFTDQAAYTVRKNEKEWIIWDAATLKRVSSPRGNLLMAFDNKESVYPGVKDEGECTKTIPWYAVLGH